MRGCRPSHSKFKGRRLPLIDQVRDLDHRGSAAALAVLPERRAGPARGRAGRVRQHRHPQQPARAQPGQARHRHAALRRVPTWRCHLLRHGATRWSAATRPTRWRCAAPSRWRCDVEREIRLVRRDQAVPAQSPIAPGTWGYDPAFKSEMSELQPGARQGAARPVRLCRPRRRRLARAARRQAAGAGVRHLARPDLAPAQRAVEEEHGRARPAHRVQGRQVARAPEGQPRRQADDVGRGLERRAARRATPSWRSATGPTRARPTMRASTCRPSTSCTNASACCPTGPSARR